MCAMMPMLRVRARGYSRIASPFPPPVTFCSVAATSILSAGTAINGSPPHGKPAPGGRSGVPLPSPSVVRERLVGLGHLVHVLAALHGGPLAVGGVHDLGHEPLGHRVLAPGAREVHEPPQGERRAPRRLHLHRYLIRGAADPAGLHLEHGPDVLDGTLEGDHRVVRGLLADLLERLVDDVLGDGLLPVQKDLVHQLRDERVLIDRVGGDPSVYGRALARHGYSPTFLAPYRDLALRRSRTPAVSRVPRTILSRTPGRSRTRPPRTSTMECSWRLCPTPGM